MKTETTTRISVFITIDQKSLTEYFNPHDPAPIYKRQLSHAFELYIMNSISAIKRHSVLHYKICCKDAEDRQYAEPLIYAIRRHFSEKKTQAEAQFEKFKRRSYLLLFFGLSIIMLCQGFLPLLLNKDGHLSSGLTNTVEIFSWVILWRPIDQLIFCWNPYLKEISIMNRLAAADVIVIDNA